MSLKVAHLIQSIDPRFGGPSGVVMRIARAQANQGAKVSIVTVASDDERRYFGEWITRMGPTTNMDLVLWPGGWIQNLVVGRHVHDLLQQQDIVHVHGVWDSLVTRCLSARVHRNARIVLAPHGMLTRWSMRQKKAKKALAWNLWMHSALGRVDRFHVLNDGEGQELRALLPDARVSVLPNGTDLPQVQPDARPRGKPYLLFLARLDPVKGPERLVDAFAHGVRNGSLPAELELVLAGPDFGALGELRAQAARLGIAERVRFPGAVFGSEKELLLNGATALCQPSRHEGFSLTLLEALAHGVPVITTPEANLPAILAGECGIVVRGDDVESISAALGSLVVDRAMNERMGQAGRRLVAQHYTWEKIAERSLQLYGQCGGSVHVTDADRLRTARTR